MMVSYTELSHTIQRIPHFELSYEKTIANNKPFEDSNNYHVVLAIPRAKKYIAWFTFVGDQDICILLELNREKKIVSFRQLEVIFDTRMPHLAVGTFLYGSYIDPKSDGSTGVPCFIVEDILMYMGMSLRKLPFGDRLGILHHILIEEPWILPSDGNGGCRFHLPLINDSRKGLPTVHPESYYKIHHFQYRSLTQVIPYLNVITTIQNTALDYQSTRSLPTQQATTYSEPSHVLSNKQISGNKQPIPNQRHRFLVSADIQSDIYHLSDPTQQYRTDFAYIPNYKISVFMNQLFRDIKENRNMDALEESDDEEEFYDMRIDKHVDVNKNILMECMYSKKFRRWIPMKICI